jgi:hypothetical protein
MAPSESRQLRNTTVEMVVNTINSRRSVVQATFAAHNSGRRNRRGDLVAVDDRRGQLSWSDAGTCRPRSTTQVAICAREWKPSRLMIRWM